MNEIANHLLRHALHHAVKWGIEKALEKSKKDSPAESELRVSIAAVRERALVQGIASEEEIDGVIYEMNLAEFLKLSSDHPRVSRVHFKPTLNTDSK